MGQIEHFTTASVQAKARLEFWNQIASETHPGLCIDAPGADIHAELMRWRLGELTLSRPRSQASVAQRNWPSAEPAIVLHYQRYGASRQSQRGKTCELRAGELALCASDHPYRLELSANHELFVVELPRVLLERRLPDLDARISLRFDGLSRSGRILNSFLLSLWQEADTHSEDSRWGAGIRDVLVELIALTLLGDTPIKQSEDDRAMSRLVALIEDRLSDSELGPATLASELQMSVRSLQKLLASRETTPTEMIMSRRLARAADLLLCEPRRTITQIAFSLGFNDSAYFCRCFRRRYGLAPTAYRAKRSVSGTAQFSRYEGALVQDVESKADDAVP